MTLSGTNAPPQQMNSIYFTDANTGYAAGELGISGKRECRLNLDRFVKRNDGDLILHYSSRMSNTGYVCGNGGIILKTRMPA